MEQPFTIEAQFHALNHEQSSPVYQQHPKQTQHYNPLQCFATNTPTQKCPAATCVIANDAGQPSNPHKSNSTLLVSPSPVLRIAEVTLSTKLSPPRCWGKANQSVTCKPKTERFKPPVKLANPKWLKQWKKCFVKLACFSSCTLVSRESVANLALFFSAFNISCLKCCWFYFLKFYVNHPSNKANSPAWIKTSLETY